MNIASIETFLAVFRLGNLNRAADELNVTQSAVTARLDVLEQALGNQLLVRSRKGAVLTKAGYAFIEEAETIARAWQSARAKASLPQGVTRLFSLVCHPALWTGLGEPWLEGVRRDHPQTAAEVWAGLRGDAERWLASGMSDAALLDEPLPGQDHDHRLFHSDHLVLVATRPRKVMAWEPDYVYVDYGPAFRAWHARTWPGDETARLSFSNPDWAMRHVTAHGGSAYLPLRLTEKSIAAGHLFAVENSERFAQRVYLSWRKSAARSFAWLDPSEMS